jgi:GYF domain 2
MKYFLWQNEQHTGPYEVHELKRLVETRTVPADTLCAAEADSNKWKPISEVFPFFKSPPDPQLVRQAEKRLFVEANQKQQNAINGCAGCVFMFFVIMTLFALLLHGCGQL